MPRKKEIQDARVDRSTPRTMDIAIVGGGPAGLLAAARCAETGLDVVLLEEHPVIGEPTHCAGVISLETAELTKIPEDVVLKRLRHARLHSPSGESCDIEWDGNGREQVLAIDRGDFDKALAVEASEAGALICTGVRVSEVSIEEDGVRLAADGHVLRTKACVLACGVSYRFQRQLGLGLPGRLAHTAQLELDAAPSDCVELHFGRSVAQDGFAWILPVARGRRDRLKVGVMAAADAGVYLGRLLQRPEVRQRFEAEPGPPIRRLLPIKAIGKTYAPRMLAIGDAGGFTKPTTGGGIFYSLLTASLAAETLIEGFQEGRLDEAFLSRYEQRWRERLAPELRAATWFRRLLTRLTDAEIDAVVQMLATDDIRALIRRTARFNWHGELIRAIVRQRPMGRLLFRVLFR